MTGSVCLRDFLVFMKLFNTHAGRALFSIAGLVTMSSLNPLCVIYPFLSCVVMLVLVWSVPALSSFPKGSKAASLLLYNMWNDKNLQAAVKKVNYPYISLVIFFRTFHMLALLCRSKKFIYLVHSHFLSPAAPPQGFSESRCQESYWNLV